jgi:FAD/FMN-containing dehydrogenase
MGGAVARVPRHATAYAHRDVTHNIIISAGWLPDDSGALAAPESARARRFLDALHRHRADSVYVNFLDADDDAGRTREAYGDDTYRRLAAVKATYDPGNVFHHNRNIPPG